MSKQQPSVFDMPISFDVNLCITNCIYKCRHCYADSGLVSKKTIPLSTVKQLIEQKFLPFKEKGYGLSFGIDTQPLLYPEFPEYITYVKSIGLERSVASGDGIPFTPKVIERIEKARKNGLKTIDFTLFGLDEVHDWFVGRKGSFREISDFVRSWKNKLTFTWKLFLHKKNIHQLSDIEEHISSICKKESRIMHCVWRDKGRALSSRSLKLSLSDLERENISIDDPRFFMIFTEEKAARMPKYIEFYYLAIQKQIRLYIDYQFNMYEDRNCKTALLGNIYTIDFNALIERIIEQRKQRLAAKPKPEELARQANLKDAKVYDIYDITERWSKKHWRNGNSSKLKNISH